MYQIWGWHTEWNKLVVFIVFWAKPHEVHNQKPTSWDGIKILGFLGCFALIWFLDSLICFTLPETNKSPWQSPNFLGKYLIPRNWMFTRWIDFKLWIWSFNWSKHLMKSFFWKCGNLHKNLRNFLHVSSKMNDWHPTKYWMTRPIGFKGPRFEKTQPLKIRTYVREVTISAIPAPPKSQEFNLL